MHLFSTVLLGLIAIAWTLQGIRVWVGMARLPRLDDAWVDDADCPAVSILFAARDEAGKLLHALPTLLAQDYPRLEVIAVNDRSRDATPRILGEFASAHPNLRVVQVRDLPTGWLGKPHALESGYRQAGGEWLIFTDADVHFSPDLVRRALAVALRQGWDHLTILPRMELRGFWETTFHTYWGLGFVLRLEPWRVSDVRSGRYASVGAFQLVRRSAYEAIGTHRRLALEVIDDMKLGKLIKQAGFRSSVVVGADRLRLRYEDGLAATLRAFTKNIFAALGYSVAVTIFNIGAAIAFSILPFFLAVYGSGGLRWAAGAAALVAAVEHAEAARRQGVSPLYGLTHPLGAALWCYLMARSAIVTLWQRGVIWRDTFYPLEQLRKGSV